MSYQFISGLGGYGRRGLRGLGADTDANCAYGLQYIEGQGCVPVCGPGSHLTADGCINNTTGQYGTINQGCGPEKIFLAGRGCVDQSLQCGPGTHWMAADSEGKPIGACVPLCLGGASAWDAATGTCKTAINQTGRPAGCPSGTIQRYDGTKWVCGQPCPTGTVYFFDGLTPTGVCRRTVQRQQPVGPVGPVGPVEPPVQQMGLLPLGIAAVVGVGLLVLIAHAQQSRQAA